MIPRTLTERAFTERRQRDWTELEELVRKAETRGLAALQAPELARLSPLYRDLCNDLARAEAARYSADLTGFLSGLTAAAHTVFYGAHARARHTRTRLARAVDAFPRAFRRHKGAMLLAALLFFVPMGVAIVVGMRDPTFAFKVAPESMLKPLAESYAKGFDDGREASMDALMAGFYVNNNVGIALRCFALGIFGGLGSALYLLYNGLATGAILGYVVSQGAGANILTFIVGHSTFELGAIVISGGAGLELGWSLVQTRGLTRIASAQRVGRDVLVLVCGAAGMLFVAAGIEAFWSASAVPSTVKRVVGFALFLVLVAYVTFVGRGADRAVREERAARAARDHLDPWLEDGP
jgi:uncharacterized membrane protein SpoIIM required for sporulation